MTKDQRERLTVLCGRLTTMLALDECCEIALCTPFHAALQEICDTAHELGIRVETLNGVVLHMKTMSDEGAGDEIVTPT